MQLKYSLHALFNDRTTSTREVTDKGNLNQSSITKRR